MTETPSAKVVEREEAPVRLSLCFKKKEGISEEALHKSWEEVGRGDPLSSLLKRKSIQYNQFHLSAGCKEKFSILPKEAWLDCDGAADLLAKDVESILSLFHDPTFIDDIQPEEDKFVDRRRVIPMIGYNRVKYEKPSGKSTGGTGEGGKKPLVKLAFCFRKKPGVTIEWADKHWDEKHGPLFASIPVVREKLIKYSQFYFSDLGKEQFKVQNAEHWTDFLGVAEFWAEDVQSIKDVFTSEDYMNIIVPDEDKFVDRGSGSLKAMIGYDLTIVP